MEDQAREALLSQVAAVATGRKQLFHDTYTEEAASAITAVIREVMPRVRVEYQDGHLVAWRPDLLSLSQDELIGLSKDGPEGPARNGALLGYGLESMAGQEPHALVVIKDENGEVISGFHAPADHADTYAEARLRDLHDATGKNYKAGIVFKGGPPTRSGMSAPHQDAMPGGIPPEGDIPEKTDRQSEVRKFRADLISGRHTAEDLQRRAKGDPELEGFVKNHAAQLEQAEETALQHARESRIVNTDDVRPFLPGYPDADPMTRDNDYHEAASAMNKRVLARMLAEPSRTGVVTVLAGGGGSGKSTAAGPFVADSDLTVDTTLSKPSSVENLRRQAEESGRKLEITYVHRRFPLAVDNMVRRYLTTKERGEVGRIVPLPVALAAHVGAQETILNLKGIPITVVDNNGAFGQSREITLEELAQNRYIQTDGQETGNAGRTGRREETAHRANDPEPQRGSRPRRAGSGQDHRRAAEETLGEEGRRVIEDYRTEGVLTDAEADAFLGDTAGDSGRNVSPAETGEGEGDGRSLGERHSKAMELIGKAREKIRRLKKEDASPAELEEAYRQLAKAKRKLEDARERRERSKRKATRKVFEPLHAMMVAGTAPSRMRELASDQPVALAEEMEILKSPQEIVLVYDKDGKLQQMSLGTTTGSKLPDGIPDGATVIHNHPGGKGPSDSDIYMVLSHPKLTFRIIRRNENGQVELILMKAKKELSLREAREIAEEYAGQCNANGDTHQSRRKSLRLTMERYGDSIHIVQKIFS